MAVFELVEEFEGINALRLVHGAFAVVLGDCYAVLHING